MRWLVKRLGVGAETVFSRSLHLFVVLLFSIASVPEAQAVDLELGAMRKAIFKIRVISQEPDYRRPWAYKPVVSSTGTGFYIGEQGILTNAHVVAQGKFISVLKDGDDRPVSARVKFIAHDCDLALLEVVDPNFFSDVDALQFDEIPEVRQTVYTIGYPTGGEQVSVTQGVVSRISYRRYVHTGTDSHLLIQVDSAINPGNSGGPVIQGKKVVGVAFQTQTSAENTGYIIPIPVVNRFLRDITDGRYDGHPVQGFWVMNDALESAAAREYHKIRDSDGGVKVSKVAYYSPLFDKLKPGDIILSIDGQPIGVDGKVSIFDERLSFRALYDLKQVGDEVEFEILRKDERMNLKVPLKAQGDFYDPGETYEVRPRFLVFAGHIFTALSRSFLQGWGRGWASEAPLILRYIHSYFPILENFRNTRDVIILADRLPHAVNTHAGPYLEEVLESFNNQPVPSLEKLAEEIEKSSGEFMTFKFWEKPLPYILNAKGARAADPEINSQYKLPLNRWFGDRTNDGATANFEGKGGR